jgi:hypothetical protein
VDVSALGALSQLLRAAVCTQPCESVGHFCIGRYL